MRHLDEKSVKNLSFKDFNVEEMVLFPHKRLLTIFINGSYIGKGELLRKGALYFYEWKTLSIKRFDSEDKKWEALDEFFAEPLKDLNEVKFDDTKVILRGFGKEMGKWLEWKIVNPKMHAEFE